ALLGTFNSALAQTTQPRPKVVTNDPVTYRYAYQHGYRFGYEDGFTKGKSDFNESQPRDYSSSDAYNRADRGYETRMGTKAEFEEACRPGFELGYNDGFFGRPFTTTVPPNLGRVVIAVVNANSAPAQPEPASAGPDPAPSRSRNANSDPDDKPSRRALVPDGLEMKIRIGVSRSEEHTSELQSLTNLVCRLLLEKK